MYRQFSSRNQRSKGIKVKHGLQIFLLLAVCFWLIYQVKHSHDKRKEFDESDAKASLHRGSSDGFIKLGRKHIHPRVDETITKNEKHDEAAEEEETIAEEIEENKHEEERPEDKIEEDDDEGMRDGDDENDERELEKLDTEVDQEEDFVDDEKEREHDVENETEGKNSDDGNDQMEKESSVENGDHDGDDRSTHEAREELYKADDASSAVTQGTRAENKNERENILEREKENNNSEETSNGEVRKQFEVEGGEMAKDENPSKMTNGETKGNTLYSSENSSFPNNKSMEVSNGNLETSNSFTEVTTLDPNLSLQNVTEGASIERFNFRIIALEQAKNSTLNVENNPSDSSALVKINRSEASEEVRIATEAENSDIIDGTDEVLESAITENREEVQSDSVVLSDTFISFNDKDVGVDLDTLPEIQTEGTNSEDVAE